jgi:hypothetical protein
MLFLGFVLGFICGWLALAHAQKHYGKQVRDE